MRQDLDFPPEFFPRFAERFIVHLHDLLPEHATLLSDFERQRSMFASMIMVMTKVADDPEKLDKLLNDLGVRHAHMGVMPFHIKRGQDAFMRALEEAVGEDLRDSERAFFNEAYDRIASKMDFVVNRLSQE